MVGISSVVSGRVVCRLPARWVVDSEDFLFRVDAKGVWPASTCVLERVVGALTIESVGFEREVGPRVTAGRPVFFADWPVLVVPCDPRVVGFFFAFFAILPP